MKTQTKLKAFLLTVAAFVSLAWAVPPLEATVVADMPDDYLADSQGANNWFYRWSSNGAYDPNNSFFTLNWANGPADYPNPGFDGPGYYDGTAILKLSGGDVVATPDFSKWISLRWQAPTNYAEGINLTGFFQRTQGGAEDGVTVLVQLNGVTQWSQAIAGTNNAQSAFAVGVFGAVNAGDQIDFLVNPNANPFFDNTVISASINVVPEPSTYALLGIGVVVGVMLRLRRRSVN